MRTCSARWCWVAPNPGSCGLLTDGDHMSLTLVMLPPSRVFHVSRLPGAAALVRSESRMPIGTSNRSLDLTRICAAAPPKLDDMIDSAGAVLTSVRDGVVHRGSVLWVTHDVWVHSVRASHQRTTIRCIRQVCSRRRKPVRVLKPTMQPGSAEDCNKGSVSDGCCRDGSPERLNLTLPPRRLAKGMEHRFVTDVFRRRL